MLDWSTFELECLDIVRRSSTLNPKERFGWKTVADLATKEASYLECPGVVRFSTKKTKKNMNEGYDSHEENIEEIADPAAVTYQPTNKGEAIFFEHHIVYSTTFRVPVLYFNAFHQDDRLLTLDELWDELETTSMADGNDIWGLMTQGEHPLLGVPYFFIHPCQTQALMQQINAMHQNEGKKSRYVLPWLSVFGPIAGLKLPMQLFMDE